ncbi:glycosyltransferase family 2 protein [Gordonia aichiensis]
MYRSATSRARLTTRNTSISVVVPVYRSARYIEACMRSLVGQVTPVDEVVLVDDRGGDNSIDIARRVLASGGVACRVVRMQHNSGVGPARNAGLDAASGNVIWFFDSDDIAEPMFTTRMRDGMLANDADFATCTTCFADASGSPTGASTPVLATRTLAGDDYARLLLRGRARSYSSGKLFRRDVLGDEPWGSRRAYEDLSAIARVALRSHTVATVPEALYRYRLHDDSVSHRVTADTRAIFEMGDEVLEMLDTVPDTRQWRVTARTFVYREVLIPAAHMAMRAEHDGRSGPVTEELLQVARSRVSCRDVIPLLASGQVRSALFAIAMLTQPQCYAKALRHR